MALPTEHDRAAAGLLQAVELEVTAHLGVAVRKVLTFLELARAVAARNGTWSTTAIQLIREVKQSFTTDSDDSFEETATSSSSSDVFLDVLTGLENSATRSDYRNYRLGKWLSEFWKSPRDALDRMGILTNGP